MSVHLNTLQQRYDEAAEAYEEGLKTSPGDEALGRGLEDVLKAKAATKAPAGGCCIATLADRSVATVFAYRRSILLFMSVVIDLHLSRTLFPVMSTILRGEHWTSSACCYFKVGFTMNAQLDRDHS